jgi:diamine N-acetyltransferase
MLVGKNITLRLININDLDFLFSIENNINNFQFSDKPKFYSKEELTDFIINSSNDITTYNQLRFVIEYKKKQIGFIDLFDYDSINKKAGIGIIIDEEFQNKNYGSESLDILIKYSFKELDLLSLYANIDPSNFKSISLFEKHGFLNKEKLLYILKK